MKNRSTNAFQKLSVSIVNILVVSLVSIPFYLMFGFGTLYKVILIILFLAYNLLFVFINRNRCLGMILLNIEWEEEYSIKNHILYVFLYTLSFSTIVIWVFFPFDLLLFNLLLIQLPCILLTGSTLHGYLSGKMKGYSV